MAVANVMGAETVWVSDIDKGACKILAHRYGHVPNLGDITDIDWATVEPVDIITGGFPCQDLSHAGKRAGLKEGTRSGLWSHMARAIDELRPRLVVAENVRGLLSADAPGDVEPCSWCVGETPTVNLRALGVVLADLADLGYDAQWCGLRAADVGACHGRFRVFLIAYPADTDLVGHERGGSARGRRAGSADGGSGPLTLLPTPVVKNNENRQSEGYGPNLGMALLPTPAVNDMGAGKTVEDWDDWTDAMKAKHGNGNGHGPSLAIEAQRMLPTPTARDSKNAGDPERITEIAVNLLPTPLVGSTSPASHGQISGQFRDQMDAALARFGDYAPAIARWESVIGRSAPDPTEPTGKNGAHRLSPKFVEWMMGLPEGWVTDVPNLTRNEALKALGNGVVPQQAEAALQHMLAMEAVS